MSDLIKQLKDAKILSVQTNNLKQNFRYKLSYIKGFDKEGKPILDKKNVILDFESKYFGKVKPFLDINYLLVVLIDRLESLMEHGQKTDLNQRRIEGLMYALTGKRIGSLEEKNSDNSKE